VEVAAAGRLKHPMIESEHCDQKKKQASKHPGTYPASKTLGEIQAWISIECVDFRDFSIPP
jgi:hypothetical protein